MLPPSTLPWCSPGAAQRRAAFCGGRMRSLLAVWPACGKEKGTRSQGYGDVGHVFHT